MVKVSVIVPVYNVENFLCECLDSIINQSLQDIEIICVNDGSTDNSLNILEDYAKKDSRIHIITKENNGLGAARNTGLNHVNGEYIYFIDSDDYIKTDTLEKCYNVSKDKSLDFLMFFMINFNNETKEFFQDSHYDMVNFRNLIEGSVFNYNDLDDLIFEIPVSAVNKFYNKNFLDSINARFQEGILFEDTVFFWEILFNANRVFLIQEHFYCRRRHESSITVSAGLDYLDILKVYNLIFDIFKKYNYFDKYKSYLFNHKIYFTLLRFNQVNERDKSVFFDEMKKDFIYMENNYGFDEIFKYLSKYNKNSFKNIIDSENFEEFDLVMRNDELKSKIDKLESENKKLKKNIKPIHNENNIMLSSTSWKITKPLRIISNLFK